MKPSFIKFQADATHQCRGCNVERPTHLLSDITGEARYCLKCGTKAFKSAKRSWRRTNKGFKLNLSKNNEGISSQTTLEIGKSALEVKND